MVTTLNDKKSLLRGIEVGADDFISKPYDIFQLRARVRTITKLNRYRRLNTEQAKFQWMIENTDEAYLVLEGGTRLNTQIEEILYYMKVSK